MAAAVRRTPSASHISNGPNFTLLPAPLSTSQCRAAYGIDCYGGKQLQRAYNVGPLLRHDRREIHDEPIENNEEKDHKGQRKKMPFDTIFANALF